MINSNHIFYPIAFVAFTLAAGCATPRNPALEQARETVRQARQEPALQRNAPIALRQAEEALAQAEQAWADDIDRDEVQHQIYLIERRLELAQALNQRAQAQNAIENLGEQRTQVLLNARDRQIATLTQQLAALKARQTARGLEMTLSDVLFEVDRADLKPGAERDLLRLVEFLQANPAREILIEGHTDNTGASGYNVDLSRRRAEAVQTFLTLHGVNPQRIVARGYGEQYPVADNDSTAGRQRNRRVEMVVLREGQSARTVLR